MIVNTSFELNDHICSGIAIIKEPFLRGVSALRADKMGEGSRLIFRKGKNLIPVISNNDFILESRPFHIPH